MTTHSTRRPSWLLIGRVFLIAIAIGYNFAIIGPIATRLGGVFDVGLGEVGLLTTLLLVTHALSQLPAAEPAQRIGPLKLVRFAFVLVTIANLLAAISPVFWFLAVTRLLVGCGTGPIFVGGLDGTRRLGGPLLAGIFGGAATFGLGLALVLGALFDDLGASWRLTFIVAALLSLAAVLFGPKDSAEPRPTAGSVVEHLGAVLHSRPLWRLSLIHTATFGTSLVVGAWIVTHLVNGEASTFIAGAIGFGLLGTAAVFRPIGGALTERGVSWTLLGPVAALVAAGGLVLLALDLPTSLAAIVSLVIGIGVAVPFSPVFAATVKIEPRYPAAAIAFVNTSGAVFALVVTPIAGILLEYGYGWVVFMGLAAVTVVAAWVNRRI